MSRVSTKGEFVHIAWDDEPPGSYLPWEARFLAKWFSDVDEQAVESAISAL